MKTLPRYMARELLYPFLVGVMVFTFILIMDKIFALADLIVKYGVSALKVFKLLLLILPATFAITVPMGCLVAVIVTFSRLKADNEITAMKASGISLWPMICVAAAFGGILALLMSWFNNTVLPASNLAYKNLYYEIVSQRAAVVIREHVFVDDFDGYIFRVGDVDPLSGELRKIVVFALDRQPGDDLRTIFANRGRLISDRQSRRVMLKLEDGTMQIIQAKNPASFSKIKFGISFLDLDINHSLMGRMSEADKSAREMSMSEIRQEIARGAPGGENPNLLWVEYHKKISIPFACLAFVLIGAPIGILAPRSGKFLAYFAGVSLIFLYYIFLSLGETFGADGRMNPFLSMWLANIFLVLFGVYGLWWVIRERPPWPKWLKTRRPGKVKPCRS